MSRSATIWETPNWRANAAARASSVGRISHFLLVFLRAGAAAMIEGVYLLLRRSANVWSRTGAQASRLQSAPFEMPTRQARTLALQSSQRIDLAHEQKDQYRAADNQSIT